jgi:LMBR1 domain-containing protein 1
MAILSFFGWILVVLFGGVGLFALPIDMINAFRHRPKLRRSA